MSRGYPRRGEPTIRQLLHSWGTSWSEIRKHARLLAKRREAVSNLAEIDSAIAAMEADYAARQQQAHREGSTA